MAAREIPSLRATSSPRRSSTSHNSYTERYGSGNAAMDSFKSPFICCLATCTSGSGSVPELHGPRPPRPTVATEEQRFALLQLPTNAFRDLRQPGAKRRRFAQLIEMTVGLEQRFDQHVFGIFAVAAHADHLPIDGVLVLPRQCVEVHTSILALLGLKRITDGHRRASDRSGRGRQSRNDSGCSRHFSQHDSIAQISVSPANVRPNPTKPQRKNPAWIHISAKYSRSAPATRTSRTCRSSDQRVLTLATTGRPAWIHAPVPPSRTEICRWQALAIRRHACALARLADENNGAIGPKIVDPRFNLSIGMLTAQGYGRKQIHC